MYRCNTIKKGHKETIIKENGENKEKHELGLCKTYISFKYFLLFFYSKYIDID